MSQNREHEREAAPARDEAHQEEARGAALTEAVNAQAVAGLYAAARGMGRIDARALQPLASAIGNQAMLRLAESAAGPMAPVIPEMDGVAPVSEAAAGAEAVVVVPGFG